MHSILLFFPLFLISVILLMNMTHRRQQRAMMLQLLYARELRNKKEKDSYFFSRELEYLYKVFVPIPLNEEESREILHHLFEIEMKEEDLDTIINDLSDGWSLERISTVDKNILRISLYELLFGEEVPSERIIINEAVELAKKFGGKKSYRFVNGILGEAHRRYNDEKEAEKVSFDVPYEKMEIDRKVAAVVYSVDDSGNVRIGMVHDIFGYWTLSKGSVDEHLGEEQSLVKKVKEETDWDIEVIEKLGESEYIAYPPERGSVRKQVSYYLTKAPYHVPHLGGDTKGLDDVAWFSLDDILDLNLYDDVSKMLVKAIMRISEREGLLPYEGEEDREV